MIVQASHFPPRRPRIVRRSAAEVARAYGPLVAFLSATAAAGVFGARYSPRRDRRTSLWYATRRKSRLNPPAAVFAPVWSMLYVLIAVAGWRVYHTPRSRARSRALALWSAQLAFNAAWSPLFFGKRQPKVALADIGAMLAATVGFAVAARDVDRLASRLMIPYLGWTGFAAYLNSVVVRANE
jgi:benzodiazapine receptor